jgi:tRNA(fMet)-specific endonuclease VapC
MPGRLLDTNAVIALQRGEAGIVGLLGGEDDWYLSAVALGELYYGAFRSGRIQENLAVIDALAQEVTVLPVDESTARLFGAIHQELRAKGKPIPENDIWIAAAAKQYDLTLVTRDGHFAEVSGLTVEHWK